MVVNVDTAELQKEGFTLAGQQQYQKTVEDYAKQLMERAVSNCKVDQTVGVPLEVTHVHVRNSAIQLVTSFMKPQKPKWVIYAQIGEYICTAIVGYGINLATQSDAAQRSKGSIYLVISAAIAVVLFVVRTTQGKAD